MSSVVGTTRATALGRVRHLALRAWRLEIAMWLSLYRFVFRRPRVPAGASAFASHSPILTILIVFIVLSALEIPIVDLIVHPWPWLRIPLLILGIWGVTWMLGLLLGYLTRPHAVGPTGILVRSGPEIEIALPWDVVDQVVRVTDVKEKAPPVEDGPSGRTLALRMQDETNILIVLESPITAVLTNGVHRVDAVRLWVDDLDGFMSAVRRHIP